MKAMLLNECAPIEREPLALAEVADPIPGPGEVRLRVNCCAICRTDLHIIEGDLPAAKLPVIPGHQVVGVVDRVGGGCKRLATGARAGVAWLRHTCGVCRYCTSGRENLCPQSRYSGYHADGGFAEYAVVPEDFAYELAGEDDADDDVRVAPLLCAGIIGYRAMKRCDLRQGNKLGLFGFGSSAHVVLQLALGRGHEVYVVTRGAAHQRMAREMGAAWAGADAGRLPVRLDSAIVFAPAGTVVPPALAALDAGGVVALAGIHMSPIPPLDYRAHLYGERDVHPVTANTRRDGRELLAEAAAVRVRPHTVRYPLHEANRALREMKEGRIEGTGVLIVRGP